MKTLKIGIIDLVCKGPNNTLWAQTMHANLASIMPQVIATWCEQEGCKVTLVSYTGKEDLTKELPDGVDLVFISAFTQAAQFAYALSNYFHSRKAVTVLGGPHARCYPDDAVTYFDYVLGFTNRGIITDILNNCSRQQPVGIFLSAAKQTIELSSVEERWKFIEPTLKKAPLLKFVPMLGSVGCPYTCPFCIDSTVPYQSMNFHLIKTDLQFLLTKFKSPWIAWHDPNFGVRFGEYMDAISEAAPPGSFRFVAESSLSILTEDHLKIFRKNGFKALLPGVESWYELGNKSRASNITGEEKVNRISEHVNMILRYIPYVQTNFVLGLDSDSGDEPFELTKRFIDRSPGAFPGYSLLTAFGEAAPLNLEYQKLGRVIPFPFHFLDNHSAMNIKPRNYEWLDFYNKVIDLTSYSFSVRALYRRFKATPDRTPKWMNLMRAISSEGYGRLRFYQKLRQKLTEDKALRRFFDGESNEIPSFYTSNIRKDLGIWWDWLPKSALFHNVNAFMQKNPACS
ncbi:B12-binding domain-containing radical SAM protein [Pseudoflavitalea rhizosphaerae]|uniref:B12-binding domain-containing radical SAM protein n=1 Tax=Pseudoflavitalea rhizosphaerae TaxID=1884793 RepID=UPI000F8D62DC|nr:radical SAM protein [Pseudoflavitalea rhizosphaerae]